MHHGIGPLQKWKGLTRFGNISKNGSLPGLHTLAVSSEVTLYSVHQWRSQRGGAEGQLPPWQKLCPLLPQMKLHIVQRSMESRHFESHSAPLLTPKPPLSPPHFEKSGYAPAVHPYNVLLCGLANCLHRLHCNIIICKAKYEIMCKVYLQNNVKQLNTIYERHYMTHKIISGIV